MPYLCGVPYLCGMPYQKKVALYEIDSIEAPPTTRQPYLSPTEFVRAVDVFKVFGSLSFCSTITLGKAQNSNESLHNMLWHNSPKSKHVGQKSLVASTALAVLSFNDGSLSYSRLMEELGIKVSHHTSLSVEKRSFEKPCESLAYQGDTQTAAQTVDCTDLGSIVLTSTTGQEGLFI